MDNWAEEASLYLIEIYKRYPVLWDPKDPSYYRKSVKEDAWKEISLLLGQSEDKCRNKMLSLLSSYRRERAKENKFKGIYKNSSGGYSSHWFAYEALRFLEDRDNPRKRIKITDDNLPPELGEQTQLVSDLTTPVSNKKLKPAEDNQIFYPEPSFNDSSSSFCEELNAWGEELRNLPHEQQVFARKAISDVLFEARLGNLEKDTIRNNDFGIAHQDGVSASLPKFDNEKDDSTSDPLEHFHDPVAGSLNSRPSTHVPKTPKPSTLGPSHVQEPLYYFGRYVASLLEELPRKRSVKLQEQILNLVFQEQSKVLDELTDDR